MDREFLLFPWQKPFLPALKDYILDQTNGLPGSATIIVPNQRPWRYMVDLFKKDHRSMALPVMLPMNKVTSIWRTHVSGKASFKANILDQVSLLRSCLAELEKNDPLLAHKFAKMDMGKFLPWGIHLATLMEELFTQGKEGVDLAPLEGEAAEYAQEILSALGRIFTLYQARLEERGWSTPGFDNYLAAQAADKIPHLLKPSEQRLVIIAGFSQLNGTESKLFHNLWKNGARICVHGDQNLCVGKEFNHACMPLHECAAKWGATFHNASPAEASYPTYHFFGAYDEHSQLLQLRNDLKGSVSESRAILLPNTELLMPVLHELPEKQVNISMGYPLQRTLLRGFLRHVETMVLRPRPDGKFSASDLSILFDQPFLSMLESDKDKTLHNAISEARRLITDGAIHYAVHNVIEEIEIDEKSKNWFDEAMQVFLQNFAEMRNLHDLAEALDEMCGYIFQFGHAILRKFPVDAEAIAIIRDAIVPVLRNSEIAQDELSIKSLFKVLGMLFDSERIPFEADPLLGLQILGMLETRLLHFDKLYIMDASDDILPGSAPQDPLLPDILRPALGLPDAQTRQNVVEYNLARICAAASDVYLYWAEGASPSSLDSGKKFRSRFVEQLVWEREQASDASQQAIIKNALSNARMHMVRPEPMSRNAAINARMSELLSRPVSATMLDAYLNCQLSFAYKYLLNLKTSDQVASGDNHALIGEYIHKVLEEYFNRFIGKKILKTDLSTIDLDKYIQSCFDGCKLREKMPPSSCVAVEISAPARLYKYFHNFTLPTQIVDCEKNLLEKLEFNGREYDFRARIDRIDEREDGLHILDYKTGYPKQVDTSLWENDILFSQLDNYNSTHVVFDEDANILLTQLQESLPGAQLVLYKLLSEKYIGNTANAAYIDLYDTGKETPLFPEMDEEANAIVNDHCKSIISFILSHMEKSQAFEPNEDACARCEYWDVCHV